jgi:hypothetical protein
VSRAYCPECSSEVPVDNGTCVLGHTLAAEAGAGQAPPDGDAPPDSAQTTPSAEAGPETDFEPTDDESRPDAADYE